MQAHNFFLGGEVGGDAVELDPPQRTVKFAKQAAWCLVEECASNKYRLIMIIMSNPQDCCGEDQTG